MVRLTLDPRKIAEKHFLKLRPDIGLIEDGAIEIVYPERFPLGTGIILIALPWKSIPLKTARAYLDALRENQYPPFLNGNTEQLIIPIPCPKLTQEDPAGLSREAAEYAEWAKKVFRFRRAIIVRDTGRFLMLYRKKVI